MIFDRALADPQIGRDILARMTGQNQIHDLMLARRQAGDVGSCILAPGREFSDVFRLLQRPRGFPDRYSLL